MCARAKGKEDAHPRGKKGKDEATGFPVISMDYELLGEKLTLLIVKDEDSGSTLCYDCTTKGPGDAWVCRQLVRDLEEWGRGDFCLETDGDAAMLALQNALQTMRLSRTLPRNPPAYNPQTDGGAEKAVQDVTGHIRTLKLALEARLKVTIPVEHPMMKWVFRNAASLLTRFEVGHDGLTPLRRVTGSNWTGAVYEIGGVLMGKLALEKPSNNKKAKRGEEKLSFSSAVPGAYGLE